MESKTPFIPVDDALYTRQEIAGYYKCSLRHIDNLIGQKLLTIHKFGRMVRIMGKDAKAAGRQKATAA
tara:strand:+ start:6263 stop:6466 length:204 start_codon:yes stop_codon:yes gene_type:complete